MDRLLRPAGVGPTTIESTVVEPGAVGALLVEPAALTPAAFDPTAVDATMGSPWGTGGIVLLLALGAWRS